MNSIHLSWTTLIAFLAPQGASSPSPVPARTDPRVEETRVAYGAASWPKGDRRPGVALEALAFPGYAGRAVEATPSADAERFFDRAPAADGAPRQAAFRVQAWTLATAESAHDQLVLLLACVSSPKLAPTTAASGVAAGDVGFVGPAGSGNGRISWIAFVRGNVAVRVSAVDLAHDLSPGL